MATRKVEVVKFICDKCEREWFPKKLEHPVYPSTCAFCKSAKWNESEKDEPTVYGKFAHTDKLKFATDLKRKQILLPEDDSKPELEVSNFGQLKSSEPMTEETVVDYTEFETP